MLNPQDWPDAKTCVDDIGQTLKKTKRPNVWLDPTLWPEMVELPIKLPAPIAKEDAGTFREEVAKELELHVAMARQTIAPEPIRKRNPTFAVGRGHADIAIVAARAVTAFRSAYQAALQKWCDGDPSVGFPEGTWWMRVFHVVNIGGSI